MKVIIQAGHVGRTTGATGAPGEQKWTGEIVPKIVKKLQDDYGIEAKMVGADPTDKEIAGDWDLFLSVHYDADIYNDRGGFVDFPDPSADYATVRSQKLAEEIRKTYFPETGIPERANRSNSRTKFYYMWSRLSKNTPCVIIEAGVGWRTPEDHKTLWFNQDAVVRGICKGIANGLGVVPKEPEKQEVCIPQTDYDQMKNTITNQAKMIEQQSRKIELLKKRSIDAAGKLKLLAKLLGVS